MSVAFFVLRTPVTCLGRLAQAKERFDLLKSISRQKKLEAMFFKKIKNKIACDGVIMLKEAYIYDVHTEGDGGFNQ